MDQADNGKSIRSLIKALESTNSFGFELLASLMLINLYDPLKISWQPIMELLKAFDKTQRLLAKGCPPTIEPTDEILDAYRDSARIVGEVATEMVAITRISQMDKVDAERFDALGVKMRREMRPALDSLSDELLGMTRINKQTCPTDQKTAT